MITSLDELMEQVNLKYKQLKAEKLIEGFKPGFVLPKAFEEVEVKSDQVKALAAVLFDYIKSRG